MIKFILFFVGFVQLQLSWERSLLETFILSKLLLSFLNVFRSIHIFSILEIINNDP